VSLTADGTPLCHDRRLKPRVFHHDHPGIHKGMARYSRTNDRLQRSGVRWVHRDHEGAPRPDGKGVAACGPEILDCASDEEQHVMTMNSNLASVMDGVHAVARNCWYRTSNRSGSGRAIR
jgi:hypothetical protein